VHALQLEGEVDALQLQQGPRDGREDGCRTHACLHGLAVKQVRFARLPQLVVRSSK